MGRLAALLLLIGATAHAGPAPQAWAQDMLRSQAAAVIIGVDPYIIGTWELMLPGGPWMLEIRPDGTYSFHSEAGDGVPPHAGIFSATDGHWSLTATTGYTDGGTYMVQGPDTWIATGRLGTGAWRRLSQ